MRNLPPLGALRAFEAIARTGSVTRAAQEMHRTHGALSRQLRLMQEHAGVPLFEKEGTGLALTAAGRALYDMARPLFDQLEQGYRRVLQQARNPGLHVACSATFAMRWLVPQLPDFYRRHPDVRIRLSMTSARDMRGEDADLVIAWDLASYPQADRARARRLAGVAFGPVCAPGHGLRRATRISHDYTSTAWDQWQALAGRTPAWAGERSFPHTHLCIEAALSGLGVALVERRLVRRELAEGALVAPYGFTPFPGGLMAVPAGDRPWPQEAQAFVDWLAMALSDA
ncbi:LysR substrate-binding domain-containing protein [Bordetella sp. 2513F-2]